MKAHTEARCERNRGQSEGVWSLRAGRQNRRNSGGVLDVDGQFRQQQTRQSQHLTVRDSEVAPGLGPEQWFVM